MTRIASHLFRLLAITAVLTVGLCSMMMNWRFGLQLGSTPFDGLVLGVFSVGLDVVKWLSPLFVGFAFANGAYVRSTAALLIWVACVVYSLTAAIGFSASNREAITLTQRFTQDQLAQTRERLKRANEDLATLRSSPRWSASSACTNATLSPSVALCHRAQEIERDIQDAQATLSASSSRQSPAIDAQVFLLGQLLALPEEWVRNSLIVLVAVVFELVSSLGFFVTAGPGLNSGRTSISNRRRKLKRVEVVSLDGKTTTAMAPNTLDRANLELWIPIHPALGQVLEKYARTNGTILITKYGQAFTGNGFGNFMADKIAAAGLPDLCVVHGLRKAAARQLAEAACTATKSRP
jgi:hypothetical protein